jgi:hypothetical protein
MYSARRICHSRLRPQSGVGVKRCGRPSTCSTKSASLLRQLQRTTDRLRDHFGLTRRIKVRELTKKHDPHDEMYAFWEPNTYTIYLRLKSAKTQYTRRFLHSLVNHELSHFWCPRHTAGFERRMRKVGRVMRKLEGDSGK